jgi:hypothetical protein
VENVVYCVKNGILKKGAAFFEEENAESDTKQNNRKKSECV